MEEALPDQAPQEEPGEERSCPEEDPGLGEALRLLENSQGLICAIFLGLALQYRSLDLQRRQLLSQAAGCPWEGMEPRAVQTAASLITLCALFGFQKQSEELALQEALAGGCPDLTDVKLGAVIILVALIRLVRLQRLPQGSASTPQGAQELDTLEEEAEPAV